MSYIFVTLILDIVHTCKQFKSVQILPFDVSPWGPCLTVRHYVIYGTI